MSDAEVKELQGVGAKEETLQLDELYSIAKLTQKQQFLSKSLKEDEQALALYRLFPP